MTWKPNTWDFKTWFVILFAIVVFAILGIVWALRDFDDAVQVAAVGLPLVTAAVLAWGLSEISRQEERKSQSKKLQDDRNHERDLRQAEIDSTREEAFRTYRLATLGQLADLLDNRVSTVRTLTDEAFLNLVRPLTDRIATRQRVEAAIGLFKEQEVRLSGYVFYLESKEAMPKVISVVGETANCLRGLGTMTLLMTNEPYPGELVGKELETLRDQAAETLRKYSEVRVYDLDLVMLKMRRPQSHPTLWIDGDDGTPTDTPAVHPDAVPGTPPGTPEAVPSSGDSGPDAGR